jgi:hypothetical protein
LLFLLCAVKATDTLSLLFKTVSSFTIYELMHESSLYPTQTSSGLSKTAEKFVNVLLNSINENSSDAFINNGEQKGDIRDPIST